MNEKKPKTLTVLGSTGSVGRQVLAVSDRHPDRFKVVGLSAYTNEKLLRDQIDKYSPKHYYYPAGGVEIQSTLFDFLDDEKFASKCVGSLEELAEFPADITVSAVSGIAGLWAAVAVLKEFSCLVLANQVQPEEEMLQKAAQEAAKGNPEQLRQMVKSIVGSPDGAELLRRLDKTMGGK